MLVILCCVLGGISRTIYPRNLPGRADNDRACFNKLFQRMPWGTTKHGWITRRKAGEFLYNGFRSPLVHELGTDAGGRPNKKPLLHNKYIVGKRGKVPQRLSLIELLSQEQWNPKWAGMHYRGAKRNNVKISLVGFYFLTRKLAAFSRSSVNPVLPATGVSKLLTHSGERVRQIESKALSALRRQTRSKFTARLR